MFNPGDILYDVVEGYFCRVRMTDDQGMWYYAMIEYTHFRAEQILLHSGSAYYNEFIPATEMAKILYG
jgi:hypothetical protein